MSKNARDGRPYIRPVKRVELSESNIKFRWIAIGILLAIAAVSIGYGFYAALSTEPGWQEVTTLADEVNCSGDFQLMYDFGADGVNPTAAYKKLEVLYGELTVSAYHLFSPDAEGTDNLYHINRHVNETMEVHPGLYSALEKIVASDSRHPYMGPVENLYAPVFLSAGDAEAAAYDPMTDASLGELAAATAAFCADPGMINLELFGGNRVRLNVDAAYLTFAEENGIEAFLDLGWMTNAFIIDYMADMLVNEGYTYSYLSSYDGYTRNLDDRGMVYALNIFHRVDNSVYMPAMLEYTGPMSLVSLRDYPQSDRDRWNYYAYADGNITTVYVDPADGLSRSSVDGITAYSRDSGCADIALKIAPVFIAEFFDAEALEVLAQEGIQSVRCYEKGVVCTETAAPVRIADESYTVVISTVK